MVERGAKKAAIEELVPEYKAKFMLYLVTDSLIQAPDSGWTTARNERGFGKLELQASKKQTATL